MMQGRADGQEWVTSFLVSYSIDSINWYYIVDQYDNKLVRTYYTSHRFAVGTFVIMTHVVHCD